MTTRDDIVREARSWIGTPFAHQGRLLGVGIDCAGLIIKVANALHLASYEDVPRYGRHPTGTQMRDECDEHLERRALHELIPGNVVLMAFLVNEQHMGIVSSLRGELGIIHVYAQARRCVEHQLTDEWRQRIRAVYAFPGVA